MEAVFHLSRALILPINNCMRVGVATVNPIYAKKYLSSLALLDRQVRTSCPYGGLLIR